LTEQGRDLRAVGERIEELLGRIRAAGDPATAETAEEVVRLVVELYGAGLERTVELAGPEVLERLVEDELVASLLVLHGPPKARTTESSARMWIGRSWTRNQSAIPSSRSRASASW